MKKIVTAALVVLGFVSFNSNAELVHTDWKNDGDRMATLDTRTGLEWLKVENTFYMSLNDIYAGLNSELSGWRLATQGEISTLLMNSLEYMYNDLWLYNPSKKSGISSRYMQSNMDFNMMLGGVDNRDSAYLYADEDVVRRFDVDTYWRNSYYELDPVSWTYNIEDSFSSMGFFLVSDGGTTLSSQLDPTINIKNPNAPINQVPVPFFVGGLALLFLGIRHRKIS